MNVKVLQEAVRNETHSSQAVGLGPYFETAEDAWECCLLKCVLWCNQRYSQMEYTFRCLCCSYGIEVLQIFVQIHRHVYCLYEGTFGLLII